ncbi:NINE protein [Limnothrix sp. FACHB-708]|uniref:NINE protein n=1 Tax=unclassified Limnothrix TaxID=2632864 RepID=UPI001682A7CA|nr:MULTISPECIES: NINE protein [unclassified Limnothrix]MBD2553857.1 NINE protein [Limnothrix sp. FACHB-708]MBD2590879.1 NINE protein [Limnothrix sp. FACHB-406]
MTEVAGTLTRPRKRTMAVALALTCFVVPFASGLHKFYLRQRWWGVAYFLFFWTMIPQIASAIEAIWYLSQDQEEFDRNFNKELPSAQRTVTVTVQPERVNAVGDALRELDRLRQEGLISEAEFEQKRRLLLDQI